MIESIARAKPLSPGYDSPMMPFVRSLISFIQCVRSVLHHLGPFDPQLHAHCQPVHCNWSYEMANPDLPIFANRVILSGAHLALQVLFRVLFRVSYSVHKSQIKHIYVKFRSWRKMSSPTTCRTGEWSVHIAVATGDAVRAKHVNFLFASLLW